MSRPDRGAEAKVRGSTFRVPSRRAMPETQILEKRNSQTHDGRMCLLVLPYRELDPGRGRVAQSAGGIAGSANTFYLSSELSEGVRKELAWASFALLRNTNTDGVMVTTAGGRVLMARGAVGNRQTASLEGLAASLASPGSIKILEQAASRAAGAAPIYLQDPAALFEATGGRTVDWLPLGARSLMIVPLGTHGGGFMCLWSERPRALPRKQQAWAKAMAAKLAPLCADH
jgi:hypothetical protein